MSIQSRLTKDAPPWLAIVGVIVALVAVGYGGWIAMTGRQGEVGPAIAVRPGMYDLRAEAMKAKSAHPNSIPKHTGE